MMTVIDHTDVLKDKIHHLTQTIIKQLENSQLDALNALIGERQELIQALINIADKTELKICLLDLQQQDQRIMAIIQCQQATIRKSIGNIHCIASYLKA